MSNFRRGTILKRNPLRDNFLVWVAFIRNQAPNIPETMKRTCPLIGCERLCEHQEGMLRHIYKCLALSSGLYRCFECCSEVKIGRYHTKGCHEQSKDRFAKLANSLRLVKRLLSRRRASKHWTQPAEFWDDSYPEVLKTGWLDGLPEMASDCSFDNFRDFEETLCASVQQVDEQPPLSELSGGSESTTLRGSHVLPKGVTAELDTSTSTAYALRYQPVSGISTWNSSQEQPDKDKSRWNAIASRVSRPQYPSACHTDQERIQTPSSLVTTVAYRQTSMDEFVSPISPDAREYSYSNVPIPPSSQNSGSTDELFLASEVYSTPSLSTPSTSISNYDSGNSSRDDYQQPPTAILEGFGANLMFLEPEEIEEIDSLPIGPDDAKTPPDPLHSPPEPNDYFVFGQDIIPPHLGWQDGTQFQQYANPSPPLSPRNDHHPQSSPSAPYAPSIRELKHRCICGFEPSGIEANKNSNLIRHQRFTCRLYRAGNSKSHRCNYPHCGKSYSRPDNLLAHQKTKNHSGAVSIELSFISMSPSLFASEFEIFEREGSGIRPTAKRRRTG